jgi:hypothetical protein
MGMLLTRVMSLCAIYLPRNARRLDRLAEGTRREGGFGYCQMDLRLRCPGHRPCLEQLCGVPRVGQGVGGQAGRKQDCASIYLHPGLVDRRSFIACGSVAKQPKGTGYIANLVAKPATIVLNTRGPHHLTCAAKQFGGPDQVCLRALGVSELAEHHRAGQQSTCLEVRLAALAQRGHASVKHLEGRAEASERPQDEAASDVDAGL